MPCQIFKTEKSKTAPALKTSQSALFDGDLQLTESVRKVPGILACHEMGCYDHGFCLILSMKNSVLMNSNSGVKLKCAIMSMAQVTYSCRGNGQCLLEMLKGDTFYHSASERGNIQ